MLPLGETILLWRLERRLSQEGLARRAGVSRPNLSAIERGKREVSIKTLRAIAFALGIQPGVLVDGKSPFEFREKMKMSRQVLERIADAVVRDKPAGNKKEEELAALLRALTQNRISITRGRSRVSSARKRATNKAWLQLSAGYPPEVVASLIQRIADRERFPGSSP